MGITFREEPGNTGSWIATLDGYYNSVGWSKDVAVRNLHDWMKRQYPEVLSTRGDAFREYFEPADGLHTKEGKGDE